MPGEPVTSTGAEPWWEGRPLDVTVDTGTPTDEMDALAAAFADAGLEVHVRGDYARFGLEDLPPVTFVLAPIVTIATAFATGAAGKAGADAWDAYRADGWRGLRRFVSEVSRSRRSHPRAYIVVRDPTGPDVRLADSVPDDALRALAELDWSAMRSGTLSWEGSPPQWLFLGGDGPTLRAAQRREPPTM